MDKKLEIPQQKDDDSDLKDLEKNKLRAEVKNLKIGLFLAIFTTIFAGVTAINGLNTEENKKILSKAELVRLENKKNRIEKEIQVLVIKNQQLESKHETSMQLLEKTNKILSKKNENINYLSQELNEISKKKNALEKIINSDNYSKIIEVSKLHNKIDSLEGNLRSRMSEKYTYTDFRTITKKRAPGGKFIAELLVPIYEGEINGKFVKPGEKIDGATVIEINIHYASLSKDEVEFNLLNKGLNQQLNLL